jgi:hypothetical protein
MDLVRNSTNNGVVKIRVLVKMEEEGRRKKKKS